MRFLTALSSLALPFFVVLGEPAAAAVSGPIPSCETQLTASNAIGYLEGTLSSLELMRGVSGLVGDTMLVHPRGDGGVSVEVTNPDTSPTNIAIDLIVQLELLEYPKYAALATGRLGLILETIAQLKFHKDSGLFFSRYNTARETVVTDYAVSSIDNFHLALALWTIKERFADTRVGRLALRLFQRMNFAIYRDSQTGLIGGNLRFENGQWTKEAYNFSNLGSEARALYSAGWAIGLFGDVTTTLPELSLETATSDHGETLKLWDGSAFQLFFPKIFINEELYSPSLRKSFEVSAARMVTEGRRRELPVPASHSPGLQFSETPEHHGGVYYYNDKAGDVALVSSDNRDVGEPALRARWDSTFATYALFMAATVAPQKYLPVIAQIQNTNSTGQSLYRSDLGWMDGLQLTGPRVRQVVPAQISVNQGMIALSLLQMLAPDHLGVTGRALYQNSEARRRLVEFYQLFDAKAQQSQL